MKIRIAYENEEHAIFKFSPSLLHLYLHGIDNMYFTKKVRFLLNYLTGGSLYYIKEKGQGKLIGYCMVSKGKAFHYRFAEKDDITLGALYLKKAWRGKRLSVLLLETILRDNADAGNAYAYIHRVNKQSNALFSHLGFEPVFNVEFARLSRQVSCTDKADTDYRLYKRPLSAK